MNAKSIFYNLIIIALLPLTSFAEDGGIDSGGGKSAVGVYTNHASIGGIVASGAVDVGSIVNSPGLIEVLYATPFNADKDGNGLPDAWETQHFGYVGVDPQADADGDATSNLMEYLAGTDPKDGKSHFKAIGEHDGAMHTIPLQTTEGRTYEVWVTNNMKDWYLDTTYTGDGTQKVYSFDETTLPSDDPLYSPTHPSKYFFRVKISETP